MDDLYENIVNYYNHLMETGYSKKNNIYRLYLLLTLALILEDYAPTTEQCKTIKNYFLRCGSDCF